LDSMDTAFNDKSLPWDVLDAKKPSAPTESPKEISLPECTINLLEGEPLFGLEMTEEWVGELEEQV